MQPILWKKDTVIFKTVRSYEKALRNMNYMYQSLLLNASVHKSDTNGVMSDTEFFGKCQHRIAQALMKCISLGTSVSNGQKIDSIIAPVYRDTIIPHYKKVSMSYKTTAEVVYTQTYEMYLNLLGIVTPTEASAPVVRVNNATLWEVGLREMGQLCTIVDYPLVILYSAFRGQPVEYEVLTKGKVMVNRR